MPPDDPLSQVPVPDTEPPTPPVSDSATLTKQLDEERRARIRVQKEAERAQAALKEREDADKSEAERAAARVAELEQGLVAREAALRKAEVRAAAIGAASRLGFHDPEDGLRYLDLDALEYDDAGHPLEVERQLAEVLKGREYLKATPRAPDAGQGERGRQPTLTVEAIAKMPRDEVRARYDEVMEALGAAGR